MYMYKMSIILYNLSYFNHFNYTLKLSYSSKNLLYIYIYIYRPPSKTYSRNSFMFEIEFGELKKSRLGINRVTLYFKMFFSFPFQYLMAMTNIRTSVNCQIVTALFLIMYVEQIQKWLLWTLFHKTIINVEIIKITN